MDLLVVLVLLSFGWVGFRLAGVASVRWAVVRAITMDVTDGFWHLNDLVGRELNGQPVHFVR